MWLLVCMEAGRADSSSVPRVPQVVVGVFGGRKGR